jgi:hypothetical protein
MLEIGQEFFSSCLSERIVSIAASTNPAHVSAKSISQLRHDLDRKTRMAMEQYWHPQTTWHKLFDPVVEILQDRGPSTEVLITGQPVVLRSAPKSELTNTTFPTRGSTLDTTVEPALSP